jgi:orotate phosphoribosyltransferase
VGASLQGKVIIVDDVISAGTSVNESVEIISQAQASAAGVLIALNRQEKGQADISAIEEVQQRYGMPVIAIISLENIISYLTEHSSDSQLLERVKDYQAIYGVKNF